MNSPADPGQKLDLLARELAEAREQQAAITDILRVISSSPGDVTPVLDMVAEHAARICDAQIVGILIVDDDKLRVGATFGELGRPIGETYLLDRSTVMGRAIYDKQAVHVADAQNAGDEFALARQYALDYGHRTILAVPLIREGHALGTILVRRAEVRPFEDKHIALLKTFADQAAIAVENARLLNELRQRTGDLSESLEQQTAISDILRVISASPGDVKPVFETVAERAARICEAQFVNVLVAEDGKIHLAASLGGLGGLADGETVPVDRTTVMGRSICDKQPVHVTDLQASDDFPLGRQLALTHGHRTTLCVPLIREGHALGTILVRRTEVRPFEDKHIALLKTFADQAAIAVENARLLNELRQRTGDLSESLEQQTATSEVLRVISSSPTDLGPIFDAIVNNAPRLCDATNVSLHRVEGDVMRQVASYGAIDTLKRGEARPITPGSLSGRAIIGRNTVHVDDALAVAEAEFRDSKEAIEREGVRTALAVPLMLGETPLGAIVIRRTEVRPFSDKQISLLKTFADQAVIAIENARLFNELRQRTDDLSEALEQQTATSEVLQVISSSPGELEPVFNAMLENATRICEAKFGNMFEYKEGAFHVVAMRNMPPAFVEYLERPWFPTPGTSLGRLVETKQPAHVADLREGQAYIDGVPQRRVTADIGGARTLLAVPMLKENELIGAIVIYRQEVRPFTDKQIELVTNFAAQAVIAIENARLLTALRQRTDDLSESLEQQTATSEVLKVISSSPGALEPVFQTILENATRLCEAKYGSLLLCEGDAFRIVAMHNAPPALVEMRKRDPNQLLIRPGPASALGRSAKTKEAVQIADITADQSYLDRDPARVATVEVAGYRAQLSVPMLKDDVVIGVINIFRQEAGPFTDKQVVLVKDFAAQAVIAIENTRLLTELRQRTDDLSESLEQQTATSDVLRVISSSPGDLEPVFNAILENATRICGAGFSVLHLPEGDGFRRAADYNVPPAYTEFRRQNPVIRGGPHSAWSRLVQTKQPVHIEDAKADQAYTDRDPARMALVDVLKARTILGVPMLKDGEVTGSITLYRGEIHPFTDKQIELVKNFAAQAVIAIENARLLSEVRQQANQLEAQSQELRTLNQGLEQRVDEQVGEIERMGRLRRFLPPQVADLIVSSGAEKQLESHRREITALFCDLRGFTGFSETSDPEDVMALLREYHKAIGEIIFRHGGTLERFAGDGVMVIFNDPVPLPNPALSAVQMALEMRAAIGALIEKWRRLGHELGFGIGISHGYATLGTIGFEGRFDYAAIGTVSNVASRLCDEAAPGQILVSPRVLLAVEDAVSVEPVREMSLKGIRRPMLVHNVVGAKAGAA